MNRPVHHHPHRLVRWQRLSLYGVGGALMSTGVAWLCLHYATAAGEFPHPLENWLLKLHGLAAFGGLFVFGALAAAHVPQGWRMSRRRHWDAQRSTGLTLCGLAALLVVTGYALFYFAPESIRPALGWGHSFIGLTMAVAIASHRRGV